MDTVEARSRINEISIEIPNKIGFCIKRVVKVYNLVFGNLVKCLSLFPLQMFIQRQLYFTRWSKNIITKQFKNMLRQLRNRCQEICLESSTYIHYSIVYSRLGVTRVNANCIYLVFKVDLSSLVPIFEIGRECYDKYLLLFCFHQ